MRHAREITLVTNQWVNSYKRLVPRPDAVPLGYEAPIYVSWAMVNRSDLIRVPAYQPGRESSRRIEYRAPDPAFHAIQGHNEDLSKAMYIAWGTVFSTGAVDHKLKEIIRVQLSRAADCNY